MGPPLFEALIANRYWFDAFLHWNSAAERRCLDGFKTGPPRRHRIQSVEGPVLDPRAKETCLNRGQKVDPLKSKVVPPGESSFGPFIVANLLKHLFQVEVDLTSSEWKLELWRPIFAHLLFLTF